MLNITTTIINPFSVGLSSACLVHGISLQENQAATFSARWRIGAMKMIDMLRLAMAAIPPSINPAEIDNAGMKT